MWLLTAFGVGCCWIGLFVLWYLVLFAVWCLLLWCLGLVGGVAVCLLVLFSLCLSLFYMFVVGWFCGSVGIVHLFAGFYLFGVLVWVAG